MARRVRLRACRVAWSSWAASGDEALGAYFTVRLCDRAAFGLGSLHQFRDRGCGSEGAGFMRRFKPKFPMVNVTSDPDRHIKLNRLAIVSTPAQSICERGRKRQREFILSDVAVRAVRYSKEFRERLVELLDPPYSISVQGHRKKDILAFFNRTDLKAKRAASWVFIRLDSNDGILKRPSGRV